MAAARTPGNVCVVPDLDDELLVAIDRLEALFLSLAAWEAEAGVDMPPPFANGKALRALQDVASVVRPTQARGGAQLLSGRLPRCGWTDQVVPLRFVPIGHAPLATLNHAAEVLAVHRAHPALAAAVQRYSDVLGEEPVGVANCLSRTVGLLTLPWDDDIATLWDAVSSYPDKCEAELSRSEQQAYDRVVARVEALWSSVPPVLERSPGRTP